MSALVLLPFWIGGYRYKGAQFPVAVNGQNGAVAGRVPRSGLQKLLASLRDRLLNQVE